MKAHVGLTIDSEQAKFSALRDFYFFARTGFTTGDTAL